MLPSYMWSWLGKPPCKTVSPLSEFIQYSLDYASKRLPGYYGAIHFGLVIVSCEYHVTEIFAGQVALHPLYVKKAAYFMRETALLKQIALHSKGS